jgi:hypothetical protein
MKQALMDQHVPGDDVLRITHPYLEPASLYRVLGEDFDKQFKMPPSGMTSHSKVDSWLFDEFLTYDLPDLRPTVPKFERTYTDVALDTFYDPNTMVARTQSIPHTKAPSNSSLLSPYRSNANANDVVQRTLQRAQDARSQSPSVSPDMYGRSVPPEPSKALPGFSEHVWPKRRTSFSEKVLVRRSRIKQHENGYTEHWIPAHINGISVSAFPDNCSALNIISEQFALRNKLLVDTSLQAMLRLPDHNTVSSIGSLNVVFGFAHESDTFNVMFTVLRGCVYDLVLSGEFLWKTQTFTTFKSRIQRSLSAFPPPSLRVCLQGTPQKQVYGSINGRIVSASPDTGSDVNVILRSCANFLGLKFDSDPNAMETLEFIDGSCIQTCGIVRNSEWQFGMEPKTPPVISPSSESHKSESSIGDWRFGSNATQNDIYICDFYVVEELTCPVILSSDLLYGTNAFTACAQHFYDNNNNSDNISFHKRKREEVDVAVVKKRSRTVKEVFKTTFGKSKSATNSKYTRTLMHFLTDFVALSSRSKLHSFPKGRIQSTRRRVRSNRRSTYQPIRGRLGIGDSAEGTMGSRLCSISGEYTEPCHSGQC